MTTQLSLLERQFTLHRWPLDQKNRTLQAWDAADEYLINYIEDNGLKTPQTRILLINDSFGALCCWFADNPLFNFGDSYVAHQAAIYNLNNNGLAIDDDSIHNPKPQQLSSLSELPDDIDLVLIKVPKNNGYLEFILSQLSQRLKPGTPVIAAAKTTDIHNSTSALFGRYIGETSTSLAKKKSRLILSSQSQPAQSCAFPKQWPLEGTHFALINHANVFSRDSLDIGARLLMANLPNHTDNLNVIDLGCGNGVIGLCLLAKSAQTQLQFVDESYMAVASAKAAIEHNLPEQLAQCQFTVDDCLTGQPNDSVDLILNNPPFHQQQAVTDHIAWQMFKDARRVLKVGGKLIIVGNRSLAYHTKLKRLFGNCQTLDSNKKFSVLSAQKTSHKG
ncbi:MAG: 23S rRNA (guanine1835-N2)-methyltransferase [Phenylobacterium sp.]|jgi:23S rRNA (guanine1835-N2)-methyltransferase